MSKEIIGSLLGTILLLVITIYLWWSLFVARGKVRTTTGRIVDICKTAAESHKSVTLAQMDYNAADGKYYVSENRIYVSRTSKVGDLFPVKYFINKPERLLTKSYGQFIGFLVATFICAVLFIYFYFFK